MKHLPTLALVSLAAFGIAACGESHHEHHAHHHDDHHDHASGTQYKPGDGAIDLQDGTVVIRAGGTTGEARVGSDGSLTIDGKPVEINPAGRAALKDYDSAAIAIQDHAVAIGVAGAKFGWNTLRDVVHGLFTGKSDEAGRNAEEGAQALADSVQKLCGRLGGMYKSQQDAAAAIREFQPYAVISKRQVDECFDEHDDRQERTQGDEARDGDDADTEDADADKDDDDHAATPRSSRPSI